MNSEMGISDPTQTRPTYALKHLATFKVNYEIEGQKPIEKLKQLIEWNRKSEVIPLDMYMRFSGHWLVMLNGSMEEIENFPGSLISQPTAFVTEDEGEEYNNILMFTAPAATLGHSEVHIFQVCNVSAVYLVEDLKMLQQGEIVTVDRNDYSAFLTTKSASNSKEPSHQDMIEDMAISQKNAQLSEQLTKDINITNHCFEDIECFIGRLQYIAEALKELDLNGNDYNSLSKDLLMARSNPPTQNEFQDILAKHKLAFNYITRLYGSFNNSTEPLHNLFISLKTIVDVCNNVYAGQQIPQTVLYPLLTQETVTFLKMQLCEQELNLWYSLGMNWLRAKHEFRQPGQKEAYKPIFYNGWAPDLGLDEQITAEPNELNGSQVVANPSAKWLQSLQSRNALIAKVNYSKVGENDKELTVTKEQYLEILDDTKQWWKARNSKGHIGYVPHTLLTLHHYERHLNDSNRDYPAPESDSFIGIENGYVDQGVNEYSARHFPTNTSKQLRGQVVQNTTDIPHPPPMPVIRSQQSDESVNDNKLQHKRVLLSTFSSYASDESQQEVLSNINEELKLTLMLRERRKDLEIIKTPQIYINQNSTPHEVQQWLQAKGFSNKAQKKLQGLNGAEIFALPAHTIENYFDQKESRRLISQIVLQKNFCEYKTLRSSELSTKLARARQKTEEPSTDEHHL